MLTTKMIGNKIAEARKKISISQAQLADSLFISSQAVGKWERGESMPDIVTFNRLAEILGVDLNYFSENFQSEVAEIKLNESLMKESVELPSENQKKKLSWDMSRGNWVDADFSGLKNLHQKFSSSNMQRCLFMGSDLSGLLLKHNNVDKCDFSGSNISNSQIQSSNLGKNLFIDSEMSGLFLKSNNIESCDFSGSNLSNCQIKSSNISNNQFKGAILKEAEFSESHVYGCDFSGVDFTGMTFKSGSFMKNIITDAVWNRNSFINSQLADVVFTGTLDDCYFENCAFTRVTFQNGTLTNTFFKSKSLKRIRFIDCKVDKMTYAFLKNGKADLTGITLLSS
jgi:uncharacterized protein YjbI with pentapeptide repeats